MTTTKEQLLAYKSPAPITGEYTLEDTDLTIKISGVKDSRQRKAIYENIEEYKNLSKWKGREITEDDITNACWAHACVIEPAISVEEWFDFGADNTDDLNKIGYRCLVFSRIIKDVNIETGIKAAQKLLESGEAVGDPLDSTNS